MAKCVLSNSEILDSESISARSVVLPELGWESVFLHEGRTYSKNTVAGKAFRHNLRSYITEAFEIVPTIGLC